MDLSSIVNHRLINQQITESKFKTSQKLVEWMGAVQAQDFNMSKWALGCRLPGITENKIEEEYNQGKILRTHLMRPTWHLVSSKDIYWMLQLTVPQIKTVTKSRHKELELTHDVLNKCMHIIEIALEQEEFLSREELIIELSKSKIKNDNNRASHIFLCAEMEKLVCSGPIVNGKLTYALFDKRVKTKDSIYPDEALHRLAGKYFKSHGPASLEDFTWWSGLKATDAKKGFESIQKELLSQKIGNEVYWYYPSKEKSGLHSITVNLLPAYDEYIISYKHRDAAIVFEDTRNVISSNGIFRPIIVIDGQVAGVWRREIRKDKVFVDIDLFCSFNDEILMLVNEQLERYGKFINKKPDIQFKKQKVLR
jgi:hypothetical protein